MKEYTAGKSELYVHKNNKSTLFGPRLCCTLPLAPGKSIQSERILEEALWVYFGDD